MTKSILITGCSSGIGFDSALALHAAGWQVIATCRKQTDCDRLARDFGLTSFVLDYQKPKTITKALEQTLAVTGGRLDALFNNGAYALMGAVEDLPMDAMRDIFETNFFGWHDLTRQVMPIMRQQGYGRILQNSSVLGFAALRYRGAYNATKFALEGLTDTMRLELADTNIDLVLIEPGPIRTEIRANAWQQFQKWITVKGTAHEALYHNVLIPRLSATNPTADRFELGPEAVTEQVIKALTVKNPKARYRITTATKLMMIAKRLLSTKFLDKLAIRF